MIDGGFANNMRVCRLLAALLDRQQRCLNHETESTVVDAS